MHANVENEDAYLHYLRQLVSFQGGLSHEGRPNVFEIVHFNYNQNKSKGKVKRSNTDLKNETESLTKSKNTRPETLELNHSFVGKQVDRISMRRDLLENLYQDKKNDEVSDEFIDNLIDFEEGLIKDMS